MFQRKEVDLLVNRLAEHPQFLTVLEGPRQVGKTRLVLDVLANYPSTQYSYVAVDRPDELEAPSTGYVHATTYAQSGAPRDASWLVSRWQQARLEARRSGKQHVLVLDEIRKVPNWPEVVKGLWDQDRVERLHLHVILLGSSPLLMQKGMSESLAGRYEMTRLSHWSFLEMYTAFDFALDDYLYFGGYPGSASLIRDEPRWRNYVRTSLIDPDIEKDILMTTRVDKPALLKQLFYLGCEYSGQILSFTKMLGQLQDAGNTVTLAHYLDLLGQAGLIVGLQKYSGQKVRKRASTPKLNVLNPALMAASSRYTKHEARADGTYWGHMVESAVGAHLYNSGRGECSLYYWSESPHEVDFVLQCGSKLAAFEVKSGRRRASVHGLETFENNFGTCAKHIVGAGGIPLSEFLSYPAMHWL
jgi:predicted AAA+ superfamily ATPase